MDKIKRAAEILRFVLDRFLIVFFFCLLIVYASREVSDLDLWLHLKTGEVIASQKTVPANDIFSFAIQGRPWTNHEWLFQIICYLSYVAGSFDGLIAMQNIVVIAIFLILFFFGREEKNHLFVFIVLYMTLLSTAYRFMIRPDIFSMFFLVLYLLILKKFGEHKSKLILFLPALQAFWCNTHGFSFLGPLLVLLIFLGEGAKQFLPLPKRWRDTRRLDGQQIRQLAVILGLMLAAGLLNPQGVKGAAYPISVLGQISGKGRIVFQYIQELAKPMTLRTILDVGSFTFYKAVILGSLFTFRFNSRRPDISTLILWLFFLGFSFLAIRNIAYFALVAAFASIENVRAALENGKELPFRNVSKKIKFLAYYGFMAFLFFYGTKGARQYLEGATYNFDTYELKSSLWGVDEQRYPEKAVDFLLAHDFPKRILNDFNSGAYLVGRTYPSRQVFIDGRTELYGPEFFEKYVSLGEGKKEALEEALKRYDIKGFFLTTPIHDLHAGLIKYLWRSPGWKIVYFDESAVIFLKDVAENAELIKKFHFDLKAWRPREPDFLKIGVTFRNPKPYLTRARFLHSLNLYEAAAREAKIALDIMPNNAEALGVMADHYAEQKNYETAFKYIRNSLIYSSGDTFARCRLALIYDGLHEREKALKVADAVIKKAPKFAEGYFTKALIVKKTDRETAKKLLREATKLAPKEPKYHETLGDLAQESGDREEAKKEWTAAFEYDSANLELQKKLDSA